MVATLIAPIARCLRQRHDARYKARSPDVAVFLAAYQCTMREVSRLLFYWRGSAKCPLDGSDWKLFCDAALTFPRLRHIGANCLYSKGKSPDSANCERACEKLRGVLQHLNPIVKVASRSERDFGVRSASKKCHLIHSLSLPVPAILLVPRR